MGLLKGWLYCFLWYSSILAGYAGLFCPLLPIVLVSNKLYRFCTDSLFTFWQYYPTVLLEVLCGCHIQVTGDPILTSEASLIVMNHRTRTDWNFLWPAMYHSIIGKNRYCHPTKFVLKEVIRHIPGSGWVMQMACFIFIKRCWLTDKLTLQKAVDYFANLNYKFSLLVFPEGTDLTTATKKKSDEYAEKHNLQKYDFILHPRTTGFVFLTKKLMDRQVLDAVYDVTLLYPDQIPQNEGKLLKGEFPNQVKVHLVRYARNILPKTDKGLKDFLEKRWMDKEKTLKEYKATGHFLHGQILKTNKPIELLFALVFWTLLPFVVLYVFCFFKWFRFLVFGHTIFLILLNLMGEGFPNFEISLYNFKRYVIEFKFGKV